jgi:hypothetical protein
MLICDDCVNYFLECPISSVPIRHGLCELCGQEADCYDIAISENKTRKVNEIHSTADSIREVIRLMYYPDIDLVEGLRLAEYTARKISGKSAEEFARYILNKEENEDDWKIVVWN